MEIYIFNTYDERLNDGAHYLHFTVSDSVSQTEGAFFRCGSKGGSPKIKPVFKWVFKKDVGWENEWIYHLSFLIQGVPFPFDGC